MASIVSTPTMLAVLGAGGVVLALLLRQKRRAAQADDAAAATTTASPLAKPNGSMELPALSDTYSGPLEKYPSPLESRVWPAFKNFVGPNEYVLLPPRAINSDNNKRQMKILRAGPTRTVYWHPSEVRACIVTCGGLCPGLNTVIRELVMTLTEVYGVRSVFGVRNGYRGFYEEHMMELTPKTVAGVHLQGGTFIGTSRGGFDLEKILDGIELNGINQVYVIGGDGTHRGALVMLEGIMKRKMKVAVACVPKTIDNDIAFIDKSFGFDTAVEQAVHPIECAHVEARGHARGVGIVKLMGRSSGAIAINASLSSRDVNCCLIPEAPFECDRLCKFLDERLESHGHAVLVVAEGAQMNAEDRCAVEGTTTAEVTRDASGNIKLEDVGLLLKRYIEMYFEHAKAPVAVSYIDPTYNIRSCPANASDSLLCTMLAANAVHGVFSGHTGFTVGTMNGEMVLLPITVVAAMKPRTVDLKSRQFCTLVLNTGQPKLAEA